MGFFIANIQRLISFWTLRVPSDLINQFYFFTIQYDMSKGKMCIYACLF